MDEKNKQSLRGLWDCKKISNIYVIRIQEGVIKEGRAEKTLKETMAYDSPKGIVKLCVCERERQRERERESSVLFNSLRPHGLQPSSSSIHWILQASILEWVVLLQGTFPAQG